MKLASRLPSPLFIAAAMQEAVHRRDKYMRDAHYASVPNFGGHVRVEDVKRFVKLARAWNWIAVRHKHNAEQMLRNIISEASGLRSKKVAP